jgi:hypothetical protein
VAPKSNATTNEGQYLNLSRLTHRQHRFVNSEELHYVLCQVLESMIVMQHCTLTQFVIHYLLTDQVNDFIKHCENSHRSSHIRKIPVNTLLFLLAVRNRLNHFSSLAVTAAVYVVITCWWKLNQSVIQSINQSSATVHWASNSPIRWNAKHCEDLHIRKIPVNTLSFLVNCP